MLSTAHIIAFFKRFFRSGFNTKHDETDRPEYLPVRLLPTGIWLHKLILILSALPSFRLSPNLLLIHYLSWGAAGPPVDLAKGQQKQVKTMLNTESPFNWTLHLLPCTFFAELRICFVSPVFFIKTPDLVSGLFINCYSSAFILFFSIRIFLL